MKNLLAMNLPHMILGTLLRSYTISNFIPFSKKKNGKKVLKKKIIYMYTYNFFL